MPDRSRNPVQRIQGYVQRGETIKIMTDPIQFIKVQKSYPGATVTVRSRLPNGVDTEFATIYNREGSPIANPITLDPTTAYYSFYAQSGRYDLVFSGGGIPVGQEFRLEDVPVESLVYNVRDYGAKGDGVTDDTQAILAALEAMTFANPSTEGIGTLFFPNGRYIVSRQSEHSPHIFDLPSGIVVQGTAGPYSGVATSNCQIVMADTIRLFRIGGFRHKIIIRDIGLTRASGVGSGGIAIDCREDEQNFGLGSSSGIEFDNVTIWKFERGISIEGSGQVLQWDITGVRVNHCVIVECKYAIYINSQNCDFMKITDSRIGTIPGGFGIYMNRVGIISLDSILGVGTFDTSTPPNPLSDTFIYITAAHGTLSISGCECEGFNNSIRIEPLSVGNDGWPILLLNCSWGHTVRINSQCELVSVANKYLPQTVVCDPNVTAMIYSFGDSLVNELKVQDPTFDFNLNGSNTRLVSRANHFRVDFQRPARFGGQAGQIAPWLEHTPLAASQFEGGDAQVALCDPAGNVIFHVRAEEGFLYFENSDHERLRRLDDKDGNLVVKGTVTPNGTP
jgi:hypothetical protein